MQTVQLKVHKVQDEEVLVLMCMGSEWWPGYGIPNAGTLDRTMLPQAVAVSVLMFGMRCHSHMLQFTGDLLTEL